MHDTTNPTGSQHTMATTSTVITKSAMVPLLRLRLAEIVRTWRIWVLPIVVALFAASGPVITRFTNDILAAALPAGSGSGISLPEPTAATAAGQWASDLSQLIVIVAIIMAAGAINGEVRSGVASLMLVKPVSRNAYVLSHAIVLVKFVAVTALLGACLNWAVTAAMFEGVLIAPILGITGVWIALAALLISVTLFASAVFDATSAAAGIGLGAYFVLAILGLFPQLAEFTPVGLFSMMSATASSAQPLDGTLWWPIVTALALAAAFIALTMWVFTRKELR